MKQFSWLTTKAAWQSAINHILRIKTFLIIKIFQ